MLQGARPLRLPLYALAFPGIEWLYGLGCLWAGDI